jgi:hypothetical protein
MEPNAQDPSGVLLLADVDPLDRLQVLGFVGGQQDLELVANSVRPNDRTDDEADL